jgi:predicted HTH domain antitoxin
MNAVITVEYPESLPKQLQWSVKDFEHEIKTSSLVELYEIGKISSGTAAKVLGISRFDFLTMLARYNVSIFGEDNADVLRDGIANA